VLEVKEGNPRAFTEYSVDATRIESESAEPALEVGDVVTVNHWRLQVEVAVTEPKSRLDDRCPRLMSADSVGAQATLTLEHGDGALSLRAIGSSDALRHQKTEPPQARLKVDNHGTGGTGGERKHKGV
jgi:hypothetical protein